jgi:CSLREA domain-containing protein
MLTRTRTATSLARIIVIVATTLAVLAIQLPTARSVASAQAVDPPPTKIMAMGDSITQGMGDHPSYRRALAQDLESEGYAVDFVGTRTDVFAPSGAPTDFDRDHEGYYGWRTDEVLGEIDDILAANVPDIVLLHIGTNDLIQGQSVASTLDDIEALIVAFRSANPNVIVFLAQVIPSDVNGSAIPDFKIAVEFLARDLHTFTSPVVAVDQHSGFDTALHTHDGVHPNAVGEQRMADVWRAALAEAGVPITLVVNSNDDANDGFCNAVHCSLREAIATANSASGESRIEFDLPTTPATIQPASPLPQVTASVTIDGRTQPGYAGTPVVEIDGQLTSNTSVGLQITGDDVVVQGLTLNRFGARGILVDDADRVVIRGNRIATDLAGQNDLGRMGFAGITLSESAGATIGGTAVADRNILSGAFALEIAGATSTGNEVVGNHLGVRADGTLRLGTRAGGLRIHNGASQNLIGGDTAAERNVAYGISISGAATTGNVVTGNYIGLTSTGNAVLCSTCSSLGITSGASQNRIGGAAAGEGNLVAGMGLGVDSTGVGNAFMGNRIGVNAAGTATLPVSDRGIGVAAPQTIVGGSLPGEGNVIAGTSNEGILISAGATGSTVTGNFIGVDSDGTTARPNTRHGVHVYQASGVTIGGSSPGERNVIANNGQNGIAVWSSASGTPPHSQNVRIVGNSIHSNGWLGIDLGTSGADAGQVTQNDIGDSDTGPNGLQNHPVLSSARTTGSQLRLTGALDTTAGTYRIDAYSSDVCDPTGNGEAQTYLGGFDVPVAGPGGTPLRATLATKVAPGRHVTLSATSPTGATSELSTCATVTNLATSSNPDGGSADIPWVFRPPLGAWFREGSAVWLGLDGDVPVAADYDGDGTSDEAVFRDGGWYVDGLATSWHGLPGDLPVPADYDGDGDADRAVFRGGGWHVEGSPTTWLGLSGDLPVPADYDGDGDADRAVFRDGAWYVDGQATVWFGLAGDIPVPADYDGDGNVDLAVYRSGEWHIEGAATVFFGAPGDVPLIGDWNGDGTSDVGVFRSGAWLSPVAPTSYLGLPGDRPAALSAAIYDVT